jgi:2-polyprenyl-3-methyl-5-hydroxy-6-metoxy-1,4-benzoquinol methylase
MNNEFKELDKKYAEQDEIIISLINKKGKLLDVGAGDGRFSLFLKNIGFDVYVCDIDKSRFKAKDIPFKTVNLNKKLPYKPNMFDVIILREVIEHIEDQYGLMKELYRILKKGGIVIITTPNVHNWFNKLIYLFTGYFHTFYGELLEIRYGHTHPLFLWSLKRMTKRLFKIEKLLFPFPIIPIIRIKLPIKNSKFFGDGMFVRLRKI